MIDKITSSCQKPGKNPRAVKRIHADEHVGKVTQDAQAFEAEAVFRICSFVMSPCAMARDCTSSWYRCTLPTAPFRMPSAQMSTNGAPEVPVPQKQPKQHKNPSCVSLAVRRV